MHKKLFIILAFMLFGFASASSVWANAANGDNSTGAGNQNNVQPSPQASPQPSPDEQEAALAYIIEFTSTGSKSVDLAKLQPLLNMAAAAEGKQLDLNSKKYGEGVFVSTELPVNMNTLVQFAFNPALPTEIIFPSTIRYGYWLPGSDILSLQSPLWKNWGTGEQPLILHGEEYEELTPNTDSGSYYTYNLKRTLIAFTDQQNRKVLLSVSMQSGPSAPGKKSFIVGDDAKWNYVYSNETGTTLSGVGWVEPIVYDSFTLNIFTESEPGAERLENAIFKWVNAGWGGINMVKRIHVLAGIERYLAGLKEVLAGASAQDLVAEKKRLEGLSQEQRLQEFFPYARYLQEQALRGANLSNSAYKEVVKDGLYGNTLSQGQLVSQMLKNYLRKNLNKVDSLELPSASEQEKMLQSQSANSTVVSQ